MDIVERLRNEARGKEGLSSSHCNDIQALAEAADEIERLRAALKQIVAFAEDNGMQHWKMTKIARRALEQTVSKTDWPRAQERAREADPRPSEEIVRADRAEWPDRQ